MPGLAEILDENSRLREQSRVHEARLQEQGARLEAQDVQLAEQDVQLAEQDVRLAEQDVRMREQDAQIASLRERVAQLMARTEQFEKLAEYEAKKRQLAKAERFIASENQAELFAESEVTVPPRDPAVEAAAAEEPEEPRDKRKRPKHRRQGRRRLEETGLPIRQIHVPAAASTCGRCDGERQVTGTTTSHRLLWVPGYFEVLAVHREQCVCPDHPDEGVWTASEPFLLPGAMCDNSLLVKVLVDKFVDGMPLNRQSDRFGREGLSLGTNVLSGWVRQAFREAGSLVTALMAQVAQAAVLQGDDSGFPVQDGTDGKLTNGRIWVVSDRRQAFFAFSRTKEGEHPAELFAELGIVGRRFVADGGSEYNLAERTLALDRGGCWVHLRRYFVNAKLQHDEAQIALLAIQDLFAIEAELADGSDAERLAVRKARSQPIVDGLYNWVRGMSQQIRPKSKLGEALGYAISQESRMRLFLSFGDVPLHNNLSELMLRRPIVGRKAWLFAGSEGGAQAACGWFSLVSSCLLQGIDPSLYLHDVFCRLPDHPAKWVHELTPLNWRLAVENGDIEPIRPDRFK